MSAIAQAEGYGLEAQLEEIREYCERQGWEIVHEFHDIASGAKSAKDRGGLDAAIAAAKRGEYEVLVVREVSRFSRSAIDAFQTAETLHEVGAYVCDVNGRKSSDELEFMILSAVAQHERKQINERTRGGMKVAARKGKYGGGPPPFGYAVHATRDKSDDNWNTLVVDDEEAKTVNHLFELAALPDASILKTAREAERRGLVNRDGLPFSKTHLGELLRNPIYLGDGIEREVLGEQVVTPAPAIVDPALFHQVGEALERRKLRYYPRSNEKHRYPIRKRIVHVHPDGSIWGMGGEYPKGRREERLYRCQSWREHRVECPGMSPPDTPGHLQRTSIPAVVAESYILKLGLALMEEPDRIAEMADDATRTKLAVLENRDTRADIERRIAGLDAERKRTLEQNRKGWITDDETENVLTDIAAKRADLEADLARITSTLDVDSLAERLMQVRVDENPPDWWADYDPPVPGVVTPTDPEWPALVAGLTDEANGVAPDFDGDLSDWAKDWVAHIVTTLDLTLVIEDNYLDARATMVDPRDAA